MGGRFLNVWPEVWQGVWVPFINGLENSEIILGNVIEETFRPPRRPIEPIPPENILRNLDGDIVDDQFLRSLQNYKSEVEKHQIAFARYIDAIAGSASASWLKEATSASATEKDCVKQLQGIALFLSEEYPDKAGPLYVELLKKFVDRFGLGYSVTRQGAIVLNQLGIFSSIINSYQASIEQDEYLFTRLRDLEDALDDLARARPQSSGRMKTLISKCLSLVEAFGVRNQSIGGSTISTMVRNLDLPHPTLANLINTLYGFRGDFPGIAHGGNPDGMSRELEMKDMLVLTVVITALTPYFFENFDAQHCYDGGYEAV